MNEPTPPKTGGLWARLMNLQADAEPEKAQGEKPAAAPASPVPVAEPVSAPITMPGIFIAVPVANAVPTESVPVAEPAAPAEEVEAVQVAEVEAAEEDTPTLTDIAPPELDEPAPASAEIEEALEPCSCCGAERKAHQKFCADCGWHFPPGSAKPARAATVSTASLSTPTVAPAPREPAMPAAPKLRLKDRYEVGELTGERQGIRRYRGQDFTTKQPIVIVAAPVAEVVVPLADEVEIAPLVEADDEILPGFDDEVPVAVVTEGAGGAWPSVAWEKTLLEKANHPSLPQVLEHFTEDGTEYLIEEIPGGQNLWDAWYDTDTAGHYTWLQQAAEGLNALHKAGALLEGFRPDLVTVSEAGQVVITDLSDLLPLPLPPSPPIRASLYTAPELILDPTKADTRADLYSFGATLYSLEYLNHALEEKDFERQFTPRQISDRFPDVHPLLLRLVNKTFVRDVNTRFPTDEASKTDPSGFGELIKTLEVCKRTFDLCRLDVAAWTTTGMVRTGNEDAFAFLHGTEARQDDVYEYAMVLLCDGMGGYEAGEVAAAMCISEMRKYLLQQPLFSALTGKEPPTTAVDAKAYQQVMLASLKHANKEVYTASRTPGGKGRRGMGCTAECVYIDSGNVIVGHVGDSRTYHLHKGRLIQLTRDQTLVNRLVELGQLSAEEAENHSRKNELQQAIGGQPDVMPGTYVGKLQHGDWVLVCSDGLTNHITNAELEKMLTRETANSAEEAARRLLNLVNLRGATDNATVVVVRAS